MSAYQFLDYQALLKGIWDRRRRREVVEQALHAVHLEPDRDTRISAFSGGMKQRVGIAQTLLHLPRILVVDEPTAGLDPKERIRFRNLLAGLSRDRIVVFSTHVIEDISSSCSQVVVLDQGKIRFLGPPRKLAEQAQGRVWSASVPAFDFDAIRQRLRVVHHLQDGDRIRVRILSAQQPLAQAVPAKPTLEDSYLWLLGKGAAD
jgi:ABC-type multidrug transport system ATPase subunit